MVEECVCVHKNSAIISNSSFALFLRVDDSKGEIEKYMEAIGIPPQNQLRSVT